MLFVGWWRSVWSFLLDLTAIGSRIGVGTPDNFTLGITVIRKPSIMKRNDYIDLTLDILYLSSSTMTHYIYTLRDLANDLFKSTGKQKKI